MQKTFSNFVQDFPEIYVLVQAEEIGLHRIPASAL